MKSIRLAVFNLRSIMRHLILSLSIQAFSVESHSADKPSSSSAILDYARNQLPNSGILKKSEGFVYVDLNDDYVHELFQFIQNDGFEKPPYFGNSDLVGAHITVIYPDEVEQCVIGNIKELERTIYFTVKECKIVQPPRWNEIEAVYFIVVEAPELDQIRKKYGLPNREYDFHITIGVKSTPSEK